MKIKDKNNLKNTKKIKIKIQKMKKIKNIKKYIVF